MGMTHVPKVVGLNPGAIYWMDIFHNDFLLNFIVCLKRPKINKKDAWVGPFFKKKHPTSWCPLLTPPITAKMVKSTYLFTLT